MTRFRRKAPNASRSKAPDSAARIMNGRNSPSV
jgi:hypothetical protein